jgi:tape measure domain-containing protein
MTGLVIDVKSRQAEAEKQLDKINAQIASIGKTASSVGDRVSRAFKGNSFKNIEVNTQKSLTNFEKLEKVSKSGFNNLDKSASNISNKFNSLSNLANTLALSIGAVFAVSSFQRFGDQLIQLQNGLRIVTRDTIELAKAQSDLYKISIATRTSFDNTVSVYTTLAKSTRTLGVSTKELKDITTTIQQISSTSPGDIQSVTAALRQLSQGLSSGTLRGEELNSVLEQLPRLGEALKTSLNVNTGELRKIAEEGGLTTAIVLKAIKENSADINAEFEKTKATAAQGAERLGVSLKLAIGSLNLFVGSSEKFFKITTKIAEAIDKLTITAGPRLFLFTQNIRNLVDDVKAFTTTQLILRDLKSFKINLFDIKDAAEQYNFIRNLFNSLIVLKANVNTLFSTPIDFSIDSSIRSAFNNLSAVTSSLGSVAKILLKPIQESFNKIIDSFFKTVIRYLTEDTGFAIGASIRRIFVFVLEQMSIGFASLISLFEKQNLIERLTSKLSKAFDPNYGLEALKSFGNFVVGFFTGLFEPVIIYVDNLFKNFIDKIISQASRLGKEATGSIRQFTNFVKYSFYDAYDKVVGNSYWPDLIDGVIEYSKNIFSALPSIKEFTTGVVDAFSKLTETVFNFFSSTSTLDKIQIKISAVVDKLGLNNLGEELTRTVSAAVIAGLFIAFGGTTLKLVAANFFTGFALSNFSQELRPIVEGVSQFLGEGLGKITQQTVTAIKGLVVEIITAVPSIVSNFVGGLIDGLLGLNNVVTNLLNSIPASGLLYTVILGSAFAATKTQEGISSFKTGIATVFNTIDVAMRGVQKSTPSVWSALIPKIDKNLLVVGLATISSVFLGGVNALEAAIIGTPLILTALFGSEFTGNLIRRLVTDAASSTLNIVSKLYDNVKKYSIIKALIPSKDLTDNLSKARSSISNVLLNSNLSKSVAKLGSDFLEVFSNIPANLKKYVEGSISFKDLFLDKPDIIEKDILDRVFTVKSKSTLVKSFTDVISEVKNLFNNLNIGDSFSRGFALITESFNVFRTTFRKGSVDFIDAQAVLSQSSIFGALFTNILAKFTAFKLSLETLAAAGGATGIVGKILLGVTSPKFLIGSIIALLAVFSGTASASDGLLSSLNDQISVFGTLSSVIASSIAGYTAYIGLLAAIKLYRGGPEEAIGFLKNTVTDILNSISLILPGLNKVRSVVAGVIAAIFDRKAWETLGSGISSILLDIPEMLEKVTSSGFSLGSLFSSEFYEGLLTKLKSFVLNLKSNLLKILAAVFSKVALGIAAAVAGTIVLGGLFALYFFGPEGSFLDKLDWAKDKLLEFVGFGEALQPRIKKLLELSPDANIGDVQYSARLSIRDIDSEKLSEKDFQLLEKVSTTVSETISKLQEAYKLQGYLTSSQQEELSAAIAAQRKLIDNSPRLNATGNFDEVTASLIKAVGTVDTSLTATVLRISKLVFSTAENIIISMARPVQQAYAAVYEFLIGTSSEVTKFVTKVGVSISDIFLYVPRLINDKFIQPLFEELSTLGDYVAEKLEEGLEKAKKILKATPLGQAIFPTISDKELARAAQLEQISGRISELKTYATPEELDEIIAATYNYNLELQRYEALQLSNIFNSDRANTALANQSVALRQAEDAYKNLTARILEFTEKRKAVNEFQDLLEGLKIKSKDLLDVEVSFIRKDEVERIQEAYKEIIAIQKKLSRRDEEGISSFAQKSALDGQQNAILALEKFQEQVRASRKNIEESFNFIINIGNIDATKDQLNKLFRENNTGYKDLLNTVTALGTAQTKLNNISFEGLSGQKLIDAENNVKTLTAEVERLQKQLNLAFSKSPFDTFNAKLQQLNLPQVNYDEFIKLGETVFKDLNVRLDDAIFKKNDLFSPKKSNAFGNFSDELARVNQQVKNLGSEIKDTLTTKASSLAAALGVSQLEVEARGVDDKQLNTVGNRLSTNIKALETETDEKKRKKLSRDILRDQNLSQLIFQKPEAAAKDFFGRFAKAISTSGIDIDISDYLKIEDKKLRNSLIAEANIIKKRLDNTKGSTITDEASFKADLTRLDEINAKIKKLANDSLKTVSGQLALINEAGLSLDLDSYLKLDPSVRNDYLNLAQEIININELLTKSQSLSQIDILKGRRDAALTQQKNLSKGSETFDSQLQNANSVFSGQNLTREVFAKLGDDAQLEIFLLADKIRSRTEDLTKLTGKQASEANRQLVELTKSSTTRVNEIVGTSRNLSETLINSFDKIGFSISESDARIIDVVDKLKLTELANRIDNLNLKTVGNINDDAVVKIQEQILQLNIVLEKAVESALKKTQPLKAEVLGQQFAENIINTTINNIKSVFSSDMTVRDFIKSTLDIFTNSIINAFIEGLLDPFTGENGLIKTTIRNFFKDLFTDGQLISKETSGNKTVQKAFNTLTEKSSAFVDGFTDKLKNGFDFLKNSIGDVFGFVKESLSSFGKLASSLFNNIDFGSMFEGFSFKSLFSFLPFASGGRVRGPGTSTSDSIAAMLSNNEYVVKAKQAQKFLPLLEAINNDEVPKFANGGAVTAIKTTAQSSKIIEAKPTQIIQEFSLQITGDVSRQTRKEIQSMIAEIAAGVNDHNFEFRGAR